MSMQMPFHLSMPSILNMRLRLAPSPAYANSLPLSMPSLLIMSLCPSPSPTFVYLRLPLPFPCLCHPYWLCANAYPLSLLCLRMCLRLSPSPAYANNLPCLWHPYWSVLCPSQIIAEDEWEMISSKMRFSQVTSFYNKLRSCHTNLLLTRQDKSGAVPKDLLFKHFKDWSLSSVIIQIKIHAIHRVMSCHRDYGP